jgi:hypothetical protein
VREENKRVTLAGRIGLCRKESLHELRGIRDEVLKFSIDGVDGEDGVFANVGVTVLEARTAGWNEGFEELCIFCDFLEETEGCATDVLVGVLL